jgi:hypothetical protein
MRDPETCPAALMGFSPAADIQQPTSQLPFMKVLFMDVFTLEVEHAAE